MEFYVLLDHIIDLLSPAHAGWRCQGTWSMSSLTAFRPQALAY
jgi:hypothetical protein